jgi:hypothetical protein
MEDIIGVEPSLHEDGEALTTEFIDDPPARFCVLGANSTFREKKSNGPWSVS